MILKKCTLYYMPKIKLKTFSVFILAVNETRVIRVRLASSKNHSYYLEFLQFCNGVQKLTVCVSAPTYRPYTYC